MFTFILYTNFFSWFQEVTDVCVGTSVGTITEPDCLGPCEPGTSVTLEGIVWHETEGGLYLHDDAIIFIKVDVIDS